MLGFLAHRIAYLVPVLLAVTLLTFLIASLLPGDLAHAMLGDQATPEAVAALRRDMGLDQPIWWRYLRWLGGILQGDFGRSFRTGEPVLGAILARLPVSLELMLLAEIAALLISIPVAIQCAVRSGGTFDRIVTGLAFAKLSIPNFMAAILLIYVFAVQLRLLPATGYVPFGEDPIGNLRCLVLPALTLALGRMAGADACAALRHDRHLAGRLHRHGQGQGPEAATHSARARPEAVVADARHCGRHQHRPPDRRRRHRGIRVRPARDRPAAARRHLYA